jgi:hypothetical protein
MPGDFASRPDHAILAHGGNGIKIFQVLRSCFLEWRFLAPNLILFLGLGKED